MRVNPNYIEVNAARALADPESVLAYYRRLIRLRKENPVIVYGRYELLCETHTEVYAFARTLRDDRLLVVLNFTAHAPVFALPTLIGRPKRTWIINCSRHW